jgi:sec-independent protein translocase protein TatC
VVLAYFMEKKDREAYPEYYAQIEKDEKELETEVKDDWDNENYNPWFSEDKGDEEDEYPKPKATPSAPPPEVERAANTVPMSPEPAGDNEPTWEDQGSSVPDEDDEPFASGRPADTPQSEKTTEELAREDEQRGGNPPT